MKALLERLTLGIQARLVILVLATVLPLVGLASFAMIRAVDNERTRIERDAKERVADLLANVDRQIISIQAELSELAVSPSLQSGDFAAFDHQMRDALKIQGTSIVLHDIKAQQLLSTNRPYGEQLPRATNSEMHDRIVQTGKPQISDLIIGAVLRRPILNVGVPVFIDGKVAYVLAMGVGPEILSALLNEQNLPPGWNAGIFDRNGLIVAHNHDLGRVVPTRNAEPAREDFEKPRRLVSERHQGRGSGVLRFPALADQRLDSDDRAAERIHRRASSPNPVVCLWRRCNGVKRESCSRVVDGTGDPPSG
jgi:hypothetical protein